MKDLEARRKRNRFTLFLPVCASLTVYHVCTPAPSAFAVPLLPPRWCTHSVALAGMLNGPVGLLTYPFYPRVRGNVSTGHLAILLVAIALQWAFVGYVIDQDHPGSCQRNHRRWTVGLLGIMCACGPMAVAIGMYHLGLPHEGGCACLVLADGLSLFWVSAKGKKRKYPR
jgi:hypothetical protein